MPFPRTLLAGALLCSLAGCAATLAPHAEVVREPDAAATASAAPLAPGSALAVVHGAAAEPAAAASHAHDNLNALAWMQTSVEFRLIAGQTWRAALAQLDRALKTPSWDALPREERAVPAPGLPPAVIVDIDETVLDNSPYQARLVRDNSGFDDPAWARWVDERAARPVPGALEFARAASARGVTIYYLSNRSKDSALATLANLRAAGFPVARDEQFLGLGVAVPGCAQVGSDKSCRRKLVGQTHRVLLMVGDQLGDLVSISSNSAAGREQAIRPYLSWVGERWFVLPNPSYGSWEPALFSNDWKLPEAERRQKKLDALRY